VSYKFYITYFKGKFNSSFEQSRVELMVSLKIPSLTDNAKRSASLNLWFLNNMDGSWTRLWKTVHRPVCADAVFISTDFCLLFLSFPGAAVQLQVVWILCLVFDTTVFELWVTSEVAYMLFIIYSFLIITDHLFNN